MAVGNDNEVSGYKLALSDDGLRRPVMVCSQDKDGNHKSYNKLVNETCDLTAYDEVHIRVIKDPNTGEIYLDYNQDKIPEINIPIETYQKLALGKNPKDIIISEEFLKNLQIVHQDFFHRSEYKELLNKYNASNREDLFEALVKAAQGKVLSSEQVDRVKNPSLPNTGKLGGTFYEISEIKKDLKSKLFIKPVKTSYRKYKLVDGVLSYFGQGSSYAKPVQEMDQKELEELLRSEHLRLQPLARNFSQSLS